MQNKVVQCVSKKKITLMAVDSIVLGFIFFFDIHCIFKSLLFEPLLPFIEKIYPIYSRSKVPSGFNCVATDMALEQSMNRDTKMKGGNYILML